MTATLEAARQLQRADDQRAKELDREVTNEIAAIALRDALGKPLDGDERSLAGLLSDSEITADDYADMVEAIDKIAENESRLIDAQNRRAKHSVKRLEIKEQAFLDAQNQERLRRKLRDSDAGPDLQKWSGRKIQLSKQFPSLFDDGDLLPEIQKMVPAKVAEVEATRAAKDEAFEEGLRDDHAGWRRRNGLDVDTSVSVPTQQATAPTGTAPKQSIKRRTRPAMPVGVPAE